jgi:hypothetical protein
MATPEYLQAISERDQARAERDEARAALERLFNKLAELENEFRRVLDDLGAAREAANLERQSQGSHGRFNPIAARVVAGRAAAAQCRVFAAVGLLRLRPGAAS